MIITLIIDVYSICLTANSEDAVNHYYKLCPYRFNYVITRKFQPNKPNPDPLIHICRRYSLSPFQVLCVGDSYQEMTAAKSIVIYYHLINIQKLKLYLVI